MKKITIIDYGLGNLLSVLRAVEFNGYEAKISNSKKDINNSSHLIIPGVGSFHDAIFSLQKNLLIEPILNHAKKGYPILGICLGMQLLADKGYEKGTNNGLGLISGEVKKLPNSDPVSKVNLKIPNIGWRITTSSNEKESIIFDSETNNKEYYYIHSFHFIPTNKNNIIGTSNFGISDIVVAIRKDNIFGTQFHPEKSGKNGLSLFKKFLSI